MEERPNLDKIIEFVQEQVDLNQMSSIRLVPVKMLTDILCLLKEKKDNDQAKPMYILH